MKAILILAALMLVSCADPYGSEANRGLREQWAVDSAARNAESQRHWEAKQEKHAASLEAIAKENQRKRDAGELSPGPEETGAGKVAKELRYLRADLRHAEWDRKRGL